MEGHQVPTAGGVIGVQLAAKDNSRSDTVRITSGAELDEELELQDIQVTSCVKGSGKG